LVSSAESQHYIVNIKERDESHNGHLAALIRDLLPEPKGPPTPGLVKQQQRANCIPFHRRGVKNIIITIAAAAVVLSLRT